MLSITVGKYKTFMIIFMEGSGRMKKSNQTQSLNAGIKIKILAVALGPLIVLAVSSAFFSARTIRTGMQDEAIKRLEDIVSGVDNSLNALAEGD